MLHLDIKPANVFLDYAPIEDDSNPGNDQDPDDFTSLYPRICLADFGCSRDLSPSDGRWSEITGGTNYYIRESESHQGVARPTSNVLTLIAPEQSGWGSKYENPPNIVDDPYTIKHSIWALGKTVFDAIIRAPSEYLEELNSISSENQDPDEEKHKTNGNHMLEEDYQFIGNETYTDELLDLVRDCLNPNATARITLDKLLKRTTVGIERFQEVWKRNRPGKRKLFKLYFKTDELDALPLGKYQRVVPDLETYVAVKYRDPERALTMPRERWAQIEENEDLTKYGLPSFLDLFDDGKVIFGTTPEQYETAHIGTQTSAGDQTSHDSPDVEDNTVDRDPGVAAAAGHDTSDAANGPTTPEAVDVGTDVGDDDESLLRYLAADMRGLRSEIKDRKLPNIKLAGAGITKKFLATELVRADRRGNRGRGFPAAMAVKDGRVKKTAAKGKGKQGGQRGGRN